MIGPLEPLKQSWSVDELEAELKALFIDLYEQNLRAAADDVNAHGAPHLGSFALVERNVERDGLTVLRETTEDRIRYLFKAWRHQNPERGLHFLRTYLRVIWGDFQACDQLWQLKAGTYPLQLKTRAEIVSAGEPLSNYFLTSRIRVDLDTDLIPDTLIRSLRSAIAARLVLNLRIGKFMRATAGFAPKQHGVVVARLTGSAAANP